MKLRGNPNAPVCSSGKPGWTEREARRRVAEGANHGADDAEPAQHERRDSRPENAYYCKACGWWHMSTFTRPQRRGTLGNIRAGATGRRRR